MKVNRQKILHYRSLPPNVEGELNGALTMQVDEILWCRKTYRNAIVRVQWWGEQAPVKFRPLNCNQQVDHELSLVFTYRIYTAPQLFYSYLEDSRQLNFVVVDDSVCSPIGRATLNNLRSAVAEQSAKQICLPVVDRYGDKVAELCVTLTLRFFKNFRVTADCGYPARNFPVQQVVSDQARGVPDSLVVQLLHQARRLRDAMAKSLHDWEKNDTHQCCSQCHHASVLQDELLLTDLLGNLDHDVPQPKSTEVLNDISPAAEFLDLVATLDDSPRGAGCVTKQDEKCEGATNLKRQLKEFKEDSPIVTPAERQTLTDCVVHEFLKMAVTIRVCVSSLYLQSTPKSSGTYFVDYEMPDCLVTGHTQLSRSTCSRRLAGKVVQFGQRFVHTLSKHGAPLADVLKKECLLFRVYCRQLSEKKRSLLGQVTMSLAELADAEGLEVHQELLIPGIGELRVVVQLGCDKAQLGRQLLNKGKGQQSSGDIQSADNVPSSTVAEKPVLHTGDKEQATRPSTTAAPPQDPHLHCQHQLLYALLHVPCGRLTTLCSSYVVCRAFWRDHILTSDVARDERNPQYNLHQVLPLLLSPELLERCRDNVLVLEVWECTREAGPDTLLGLAKVVLHPFYLAYKDSVMVSQLLLAKYPVVSADRWVQVVCPSSGSVRGELRVLLALGSEDQVMSLGASSGGVLGPAGDGLSIPQRLHDDLHSQDVDATSGTIYPVDVHPNSQDMEVCPACATSDKSHSSVQHNPGQAKAIRRVRGSRSELSSNLVNSTGQCAQQNEGQKSVNFGTSCTSEMWKQKNEGSNSSGSLRPCECSRKGGVPSAQTIVQGKFAKLADGHSDVHMPQNIVPVPHDIAGGARERLQQLLSSIDTREKQDDFARSGFCSSDYSCDSAESLEPRKKVKFPVASAGQDIMLNSSIRCAGDAPTKLSDLEKNLTMLNLAGGDTLQMENLAPLRRRSYEPDPVNERIQELEGDEPMMEHTTVDHSSVDCFSPGHSTDTRYTNVESLCGFNSERGCGDLVAAGCNAENKTVSEKSTLPISGSSPVDEVAEEECSERFSARVEVEQAVHLKLKVPQFSSYVPKVYVTFQANGNGQRLLSSPAVKAGESPVWGWYCDTQLAAHLLTNDEKRLILKVWQVSGGDADTVLGFAVIDLTSLLRGFSFVSGWYSLVDYEGCCVGQIKVTVVPLEDLSRFNCSPEMELTNQDSNDHFEADMYSNLKEKLSELDEITARLRRRLGTVVSDENTSLAPATDVAMQATELENNSIAASSQQHSLEDKCIQASAYDEDTDAWTDWLMGATMRDLELENVFNPLLFQQLISQGIEPPRSRQDAEKSQGHSACAGHGTTEEAVESKTGQVDGHGDVCRSQTVAERLQAFWKSPEDLPCSASRQAPDGVSVGENSTSISQLSVLEETKNGKT